MNLIDQSSTHFLNAKGKSYFSYQNKGGLQRGRINARKFFPYLNPEDNILDFGCGNGSLLYHLECRKKIGVETNATARMFATQLGIEVYADLDAIQDGSVDVAISNHVLEHVLSPLYVLAKIRTKLVEKGRLILCVPIDDWRTQKFLDVKDINHHLYTWTPLLMGHLLTEAGYKPDRIWIYTHAWPPTHWQKFDKHLPVWLFDLVCRLTAWRHKRRQLMALAYTK